MYILLSHVTECETIFYIFYTFISCIACFRPFFYIFYSLSITLFTFLKSLLCQFWKFVIFRFKFLEGKNITLNLFLIDLFHKTLLNTKMEHLLNRKHKNNYIIYIRESLSSVWIIHFFTSFLPLQSILLKHFPTQHL